MLTQVCKVHTISAMQGDLPTPAGAQLLAPASQPQSTLHPVQQCLESTHWSECRAVLCRRDILRARQQWRAFLEAAPSYPAEKMFTGQGVCILGGGNKYMVPAWVNVHMLRATGANPREDV